MPQLTLSISRTAVSYELTALSVDLIVRDVAVAVTLKDVAGGVVEERRFNMTFNDLGITAIQADAITAKILNWLKASGAVN